MVASTPIEIVSAEIETPLFTGNAGYWARLSKALRHNDSAERDCYQQGSELRYPERDFDGTHVAFSATELEQSQREHIMGLDIADRIATKFKAETGSALAGNIGVFVAQSESSHRRLNSDASGHFAIGNSRAVVANRISYRFGWTGPSLSVDTACSSGLFALHIAAQEIQSHNCEAALVLGISNFHDPVIGDSLRAAQLLSPTGSLNALHGARDGYIRSEGVAGILLASEDFTKGHGLSSYLTIKATAISQNSNAQHFSIPDVGCQKALYRAALERASWEASDLDHIEMHATGTMAGDKSELAGILSVFGHETRSSPLTLGAVKSNIGHLEGASALAAMVKLVLSMANAELPPTVSNEKMLNIPVGEGVEIQNRAVSLAEKSAVRLGVSSFGFGGSNAFLLAEGHPANRSHASAASISEVGFSFPRLKHAENDAFELDLRDTFSIGSLDAVRVLKSGAALSRDRGSGVSNYRAGPSVKRLGTTSQRKRPLFCFGGQSIPVNTHHRTYFQTNQVYRKTMERLNQKFSTKLSWSLIDHYFASRPTKPSLYDQVFAFAHQLAMAAILHKSGCMPAAVLGYSVGEFVAYVVAGGLAEDTAVALLSCRTQAMLDAQEVRPAAHMFEVVGSPEDVVAFTRSLKDSQIGAEISAGKVIVSGHEDQIMEELDAFETLAFRKLKVADAFHSSRMATAQTLFAQKTTQFGRDALQPFTIPVFSTVTGQQLDRPNHRLMIEQITETVAFAAAFGEAKRWQAELTPLDLSSTGQIVSYSPHLSDRVISVAQLVDPKNPTPEATEQNLTREGFIDYDLSSDYARDPHTLIFAPILPLWTPNGKPSSYHLSVADPTDEPDEVIAGDHLGTFERLMKKVLGRYDHSQDAQKKWFEILSDSFQLTMIIYEMNTAFCSSYDISSVMTKFGTPDAFFEALLLRRNSQKHTEGPIEANQDGTDPVAPRTRNDLLPSSTGIMHNAFLEATVTSREVNDLARKHLANPRSKAAYFSRYPVIAGNNGPTRLVDVDSNELVDLAMGFGTLFLGHKNELLLKSMAEFATDGASIGPDNVHSSEVARLLCQQTGYERAAFTTTGTEAVMVALRLARSHTKRPKVVTFKESYHGHYDGVLGLGTLNGGRAIPADVGISPGAVSEVLMYDYGDLDILKDLDRQSDSIAAVLIEPVQSRNLHVPNSTFLRTMRDFCDRNETVLIFDEILTGFRNGLQGAKDVFGVEPDLALFGKMIGNGMPIAAIVGSEALLSHVDGGRKQLLDADEELAPTTYLLGTFNKNGLSILAMRDVMRTLAESPDLIAQAQYKVLELSKQFRAMCPPELVNLLMIRRYGSVFRFETRKQVQAFQQLMISHGVYIFEAGTCFMSPAHTDEDLAQITQAIVASLKVMVAEELLDPDTDTFGEAEIRAALTPQIVDADMTQTVEMNDVQFGILKECLVNPNATLANTIGFALMIRPDQDETNLLDRFAEMTQKHQVFRLCLPDAPLERAKWRFRRTLLKDAAFLVGPVPESDGWMTMSKTDLSAPEFYSTIAPLGSSNRLGLFGTPFFHVDIKHCRDNGKVICFSFHHIAFDGETVGTIRSLLSKDQDALPENLLSFSELNTKAKHCSTLLQDIGIEEILDYSIAKPQNGQNASAQSYQVYEKFEYYISGARVGDIQKKYSINANMAAFSVFSIALGRYFNGDKVMINCTEAGRNQGGHHLEGFGMLARYFPCSVDLPRLELCSETAASIVTSYWNGFNNDFSSYLSQLRRIEIDAKTKNFQFSYNYDGFVERPEISKFERTSVSVYPKLGIFDIVVNVCSSRGEGDKLDGHPGLLFKVDYAPEFICKEKLWNAFD